MPSKFENLKKELAKKNNERSISPLERWVKTFLHQCQIFEYEAEYQVDYYFIDIAFPKIKYGIELDGKEFHKDKERDKKRDEYLIKKGWTIKRIPSNECWNPKKLAPHLKEIWNKVYKKPFSWGLAELLDNQDKLHKQYSVPQKEEPIYCKKCDECHLLEEQCLIE